MICLLCALVAGLVPLASSEARQALDVYFPLDEQNVEDHGDALVTSDSGSMTILVKRADFNWFEYFSLPKNANFRNSFTISTEVTAVQERGIAGIALGNGEIDLLWAIRQEASTGKDNGSVQIGIANQDEVDYLKEKTITYPKVPFTLRMDYNVNTGEVAGYLNDTLILRADKRDSSRLVAISTVKTAALYAGSLPQYPKASVTFKDLALQAE
jgi:hypothetical protein